jgi:hypothetical protein
MRITKWSVDHKNEGLRARLQEEREKQGYIFSGCGLEGDAVYTGAPFIEDEI